ncbi:hypothetical protein JZU54_04425 [bacterium]|nr:hypothetical protein [bacterium]
MGAIHGHHQPRKQTHQLEIARRAQNARLREAFVQDSQAALSGMKASGLGHELGDVRTYFSELSKHRKGLQTKPQDLAPTPLG